MNVEDTYDIYSSIDYENATVDPHSIFDWHELLPTLVVYGITFVLGLTGNILIIFTIFKYRRMKSITNIFLSSLASADLLLIIFCIPVKVARLFSYTWEMGLFVCKGVHYMQNLSTICSVLTLTAISLERYYAIVHPMKAKYICTMSQAKRMILIIWVLSILLAIPTLEGQSHLPVGPNNEYRYCVRNWDNPAIWKFHELYIFVLVLVVPFFIMTFSYAFICWEIWKVMERRSVMTSEQALSRNYTAVPVDGSFLDSFNNGDKKVKPKNGTRDDTTLVKQVVCMLVTVVVLFAICWSPLLIDNLLTAYEVFPPIRFGALKYMSITFSLMAYFNSCINPIIYGFMSKNFRESFGIALCLSEKKKVQRGGSYNMRQISRRGSQTRSTSIR